MPTPVPLIKPLIVPSGAAFAGLNLALPPNEFNCEFVIICSISYMYE
jgi:hypothetical protein